MLSKIFGGFLSAVGLLLMMGGVSVFPVSGPSNVNAELAVIGVVGIEDCKGTCDQCGTAKRDNPGVLPAIYSCTRANNDGTFSAGSCKTNGKSCGLCSGGCGTALVGGNRVCLCDQAG